MIDKKRKNLILLYGLFSAVTFFLFVTPYGAAAGIPVFSALQFGALWFVIEDRRKLWYFVPIMILSLNYFVSASSIWSWSNFYVCILLYGTMLTNFSLVKKGAGFIANIFKRLFSAFKNFKLPFKWTAELAGGKSKDILRVLRGVAVSIPCVLVLAAVLAKADMVFAQNIGDVIRRFFELVRIETIFNICISCFAGLYLFGLIASWLSEKDYPEYENLPKSADFLVMNIILFSVLAIYVLFSVVQFKYLFAGAQLPDGLSYTEYARKGFFELLGLSGVNILLILFSSNRVGSEKGQNITKVFNLGLCAVTAVLLASSFYRMYLYCLDDGLTRLRFLVMCFLGFEAVGLALTAVYILKPKFNMTAVYCIIALVYYCTMNIVPIDYFVAKSQVDMYLDGKRTDLNYACSLSADALPQLMRVPAWNITDMEDFYGYIIEDHDWRSLNLSEKLGKNMLKEKHIYEK